MKEQTAIALGYFDGLHIAHRAVLAAALEQKKNGRVPTVLLFDRPPYEAVTGVRVPRLMTDADRENELLAMGFRVETLSFDAVRDLEPEAFLREILIGRFGCGFVSCGYNYTFGKGGRGTAETLRELCETYGLDLSVCDRVRLNGRDVCSSAIRDAVTAGDLRTAVAMLGAPLSFSAPVVAGEHRGAGLGAPTANQLLPPGFIVPKAGVYAAFAAVDGCVCPAVTDIGTRPTFGGTAVRCETYIMDFSGDLYGKTVRLSLLDFLREERRFPSAAALREQIVLDAVAAGALTEKSPFFKKMRGIHNGFKQYS